MAITPYLFYEDVSAALKFLSKAFGFRRFGPMGKTAQGRVNHASMRLGREPDAVVMMGWPGAKYKSVRRLGQATFNLYVSVGDVDRHCARARKAGAKIIEEPHDTP
jgi:uncharacterized glyoxalase superfamily protein PhnB